MKTYCIDIDGTICSNTNGDYKNAVPYKDRINQINQLYDEGNNIIYFTARGYTTGIDWSETTENQLENWGCKFHEFKIGKPFADIYIDDKAKDIFGWFD